jgi:hypothetical protein
MQQSRELTAPMAFLRLQQVAAFDWKSYTSDIMAWHAVAS